MNYEGSSRNACNSLYLSAFRNNEEGQDVLETLLATLHPTHSSLSWKLPFVHSDSV